MAHHSSPFRNPQCAVLPALFLCTAVLSAELPEERPLWPGADFKNAIHYDVKETVRTNQTSKGSPSGSNRVFSYVAEPTYSIHQAAKADANGVGLVICPGGGYREVWLDREGHDLALWLKPRGITSLVLKYRTNNGAEGDDRKYPWDVYLPAVFADARQAIRILHSHAAELNLDPNKIGICGFSAGGNLAFNTVFRPEPAEAAHPVSGNVNFAGLFYPWLREEFGEMIAQTRPLPPLFIMNAIDDKLTPVNRCLDFSQTVLKAGGRVELHLFAKGGHGFDLGDGRGESATLWKESFVAWLKDCGFIP
ncbi:MAG: alpha/beta hydrolase [Verrucomicrobiota bacterium]|jgi:acetyl esterase/lipase